MATQVSREQLEVPGALLQMVYDDSPAVTTLPQSGGQIPDDATEPLITEGTEIFDVAFTPLRDDSRLVVEIELHWKGATNNPDLVVSVWDDTTLIGATVMDTPTSTDPQVLRFRAFVASTGATTLRNITVRGGPDSATSDITLDGNFTAQNSSVSVSEIAT